MAEKYEFENGVELEIQDGEDLYQALYRKYCCNCTKAHICHERCSEFDDSCENIEEVTEIMDELGVKSL